MCTNGALNLITDDDECLMGSHKCSENSVCEDTFGSYTCRCAKGYIAQGAECIGKCDSIVIQLLDAYGAVSHFIPAQFCLVVFDPCIAGLDNCGNNSNCIKQGDSYKCDCYGGYVENKDGDCVSEYNVVMVTNIAIDNCNIW